MGALVTERLPLIYHVTYGCDGASERASVGWKGKLRSKWIEGPADLPGRFVPTASTAREHEAVVARTPQPLQKKQGTTTTTRMPKILMGAGPWLYFCFLAQAKFDLH